MTKIININIEETNRVSDLHYKYAASLDILSYLVSQNKNNISPERLQEYINYTEDKFIKLEQLKTEISKKYLPEDIDKNNYNYTFDFNNNSIVYED